MGSANTLQSGRFSAPKAHKRAFRLAAIAALALGFAPSRAAAQSTTITGCPGTITTSVTLGSSITVPSTQKGACIVVGASGLTVNLAGYTIDVSQVGDSGFAIDAGAFDNTTIVSGTIITNYITSSATSAVTSEGGANLTISGLTLENEPNGTACSTLGNTDQNYGTAISVSGITGGTIGSNNASCYQTGISVTNSAVPRKSSGSISGNTLQWNTYNMEGATAETYSAGLVLSNSSGWTVSNNFIEFNGSGGTDFACTPTGTVLTCAAGLQIINGSSSVTVTGNTVSSNFAAGIMTGSDTSKISITSNTAQNNGIYDIYVGATGHGNSVSGNTCVNTNYSKACI